MRRGYVLAVAPDGPVRSPVYGAATILAAVSYVAGAAALVRSYQPVLTAREVADRLLSAADHPFAAVTTIPNTDVPANRALWLAGGVTAVALLLMGPTIAAAARRRRAS